LEIDILDKRFCIKQKQEYSGNTFQEIGDKHSLSRERVRQISKKVFSKLKYAVRELYKSHDDVHKKYFQDESIIPINESIVEKINSEEKTNFSRSFISLVFSFIPSNIYNHYVINDNIEEFYIL